ncbi:MAG: membrane protein insertion efficiency factor YidD [Thermotogae bacterium]|nr:membrane protein insertion efficiency factor YidD [Thermotogota bacterium]
MRDALVWALKVYRRYISPVKPPTCRYVPTCSEYSIEALQKYGLIKGGAKSLWRILRCNPFSKGGWDPP